MEHDVMRPRGSRAETEYSSGGSPAVAGVTVTVMLVDVAVTAVMRGGRGVSVGSGAKGTPASTRKRVKAETRE
jgi:hypothetical protein